VFVTVGHLVTLV